VGSIAGSVASAPGNLVDKAFVTFPAAAVKTIVDKDNYGKTVYLDQPTTPGTIEPRQRPASKRPYRPLSLFEGGDTAPPSAPLAEEDVCGVEAEG
jgi:hypothetical protein